MAWSGYFAYDGTEIINVNRTERYARNKPWFKPTHRAESLHESLGHLEYDTPISDEAPWYDPAEPASRKFLGVYPLNITGMMDSTRASTVVESITEGAIPGRIRHGSKAPVFSVVLLADDEAGAEYGLRWLRRALLGHACSDSLSTNHPLGSTLNYYASRPPSTTPDDVSPVEATIPLRRNMRRVVFNTGPQMLAQFDNLSCGGSAWNVQFSAVVGVPAEFGHEHTMISGYMDPAVTNPWAPGVVAGTYSTSALWHTDAECEPTAWGPLFDPECPPLVAPPGPPTVPLGCFTPPDLWQRRQVVIPALNVPVWGSLVPVIQVYAPTDQRNVRIRFYEDPDESVEAGLDECAFIGDAILSYVPAESTITLDGATQEIMMTTVDGSRRRADSLVFASDGTPFVWPSLTCGMQHVMTIDLADSAVDTPVVDLSLVQRIV